MPIKQGKKNMLNYEVVIPIFLLVYHTKFGFMIPCKYCIQLAIHVYGLEVAGTSDFKNNFDHWIAFGNVSYA